MRIVDMAFTHAIQNVQPQADIDTMAGEFMEVLTSAVFKQQSMPSIQNDEGLLPIDLVIDEQAQLVADSTLADYPSYPILGNIGFESEFTQAQDEKIKLEEEPDMPNEIDVSCNNLVLQDIRFYHPIVEHDVQAELATAMVSGEQSQQLGKLDLLEQTAGTQQNQIDVIQPSKTIHSDNEIPQIEQAKPKQGPFEMFDVAELTDANSKVIQSSGITQAEQVQISSKIPILKTSEKSVQKSSETTAEQPTFVSTPMQPTLETLTQNSMNLTAQQAQQAQQLSAVTTQVSEIQLDKPQIMQSNDKVNPAQPKLNAINRNESNVLDREFTAEIKVIKADVSQSAQPISDLEMKQPFVVRHDIRKGLKIESKAQELESLKPQQKETANSLHINQLDMMKASAISIKNEPKIDVADISRQLEAAIEKNLPKVDGRTEFTVELNPKNLGKVVIELVNEAGKLSVRMIAEEESTRQLLSGKLEHIQSNIKDNGLQLESFQIINPKEQTSAQDYKGSAKNPYYHDESQKQTDEDDTFADMLMAM